jgi:hypothetical protein
MKDPSRAQLALEMIRQTLVGVEERALFIDHFQAIKLLISIKDIAETGTKGVSPMPDGMPVTVKPYKFEEFKEVPL